MEKAARTVEMQLQMVILFFWPDYTTHPPTPTPHVPPLHYHPPLIELVAATKAGPQVAT